MGAYFRRFKAKGSGFSGSSDSRCIVPALSTESDKHTDYKRQHKISKYRCDNHHDNATATATVTAAAAATAATTTTSN